MRIMTILKQRDFRDTRPEGSISFSFQWVVPCSIVAGPRAHVYVPESNDNASTE